MGFNMFNATGNLQPSFHGSGRYVRIPENIQRVRLAVQRSPSRSAVRKAAALLISDRTLNRDDIWFQHDGATAHTARNTLRLLRNSVWGYQLAGSIPRSNSP